MRKLYIALLMLGTIVFSIQGVHADIGTMGDIASVSPGGQTLRSGSITVINGDNPANLSNATGQCGIIKNLTIWQFGTTLTGVKIVTFYNGTSGYNYFTARASASVGDVTTSPQIYNGLSISVCDGDYIGMVATGGTGGGDSGGAWGNIANSGGHAFGLGSDGSSANNTAFSFLGYQLAIGANFTYTTNMTSTSGNYTILQTLYTSPIAELQSSQINYMINASTNLTNIDATLHYNNTAYVLTKTLSGTIYNFSAIVTAPIVTTTTNIQFNLSLQLTFLNGTITNDTTPTSTQQVLAIGLQSPACTASATRILNFTFFDEETNTKFDVPIANSTSDIMESNFRVYQNTFGDLGNMNYSYNFSSSNSYVICSLDNSSSFKIDADIRYYNTTSYTFARFYYFRGLPVSNVTQYYNLYLLQDSLATGIPFTIKEANGIDLASNVVIVAQRQILQNGSYTAAAMSLTSSTGSGFIYLHAGTVNYQFALYRNGVLLNTILPSVIATSAATNGLFFSLGTASLSDVLSIINQATGNCPVAGGIITCSYTDPTGSLNISYLTVIKDSVVTKTQVCQVSSKNKTDSLSCNLTSSGNGTYYYQLGAYFNEPTTGQPFWSVLQDGTFSPGLSTPYGVDGLMFGVILILIFVMIGSFNPVVSIFMATTALVISVAMGMVVVSSAALIGLVFVGIITAIKIRG